MKPEKQQKMQMEKDTLANLKGAEFDKTFAAMMAQGHRRVIEMAKGWKANCKDQDVCALIDALMPKLQQHLQMAEKLRGPLPQGRTP
jgi:predicted outer membrane protein